MYVCICVCQRRVAILLKKNCVSCKSIWGHDCDKIIHKCQNYDLWSQQSFFHFLTYSFSFFPFLFNLQIWNSNQMSNGYVIGPHRGLGSNDIIWPDWLCIHWWHSIPLGTKRVAFLLCFYPFLNDKFVIFLFSVFRATIWEFGKSAFTISRKIFVSNWSHDKFVHSFVCLAIFAVP